MKRLGLSLLAVGLVAICASAANAEITTAQFDSSKEAAASSGVIRTAELQSSDTAEVDQVRWGRRSYYRPYRYGYAPRYSSSYRYPSYRYNYGYSYPRSSYYGYSYPRYSYGYRYPSYGYSYGYPSYGYGRYSTGYRGGGVYVSPGRISIGW